MHDTQISLLSSNRLRPTLSCCCIDAFSQSEEHKRQLQYAIAKSRGDVALTLVIIDIVYTAAFSCIIIGLALGLSYPYGYYRFRH